MKNISIEKLLNIILITVFGGFLSGFVVWLIMSFIGFFNDKSYSFTFISIITCCIFLIIGLITEYSEDSKKEENSSKDLQSRLRKEGLEDKSYEQFLELKRLSDDFTNRVERLQKITDEDELNSEYRKLAEEILTKHNEGKPTGVSRKNIERFKSEFPEFVKP